MASLTLHLPPEVDQQLRQEARVRGLPPAEYARRLIEERLAPRRGVPAESDDERQSRVRAVAGKYARVGGSVDDFIRDKAERIRQEEERDRRRSRDAG